MTRTIAISGSSGYVGAGLVRLVERLGWRTVGLDRIDPPVGAEPSTFIRGDVRDGDDCAALVRGVDAVVHAAASVPLTRAKDLVDINVRGTYTLAQASRGVDRFVQISSSAVYGKPATLPVTTESPTAPVEEYGWSKLLAERAAMEALEGTDTACTIIRPRTVVDVGRGGIFSFLFEAIRNGLAVPVFGARTTIQLAHLDDLGDLIVSALDGGIRAPVVNLGTNSVAPLALELERLIEAVNSSARVLILPERPATLAAVAAVRTGVLPFSMWHARTYGASNVIDLSELMRAGFTPLRSNHDCLAEAYNADTHGRSVHTGTLRAPMLAQALGIARRFM